MAAAHGYATHQPQGNETIEAMNNMLKYTLTPITTEAGAKEYHEWSMVVGKTVNCDEAGIMKEGTSEEATDATNDAYSELKNGEDKLPNTNDDGLPLYFIHTHPLITKVLEQGSTTTSVMNTTPDPSASDVRHCKKITNGNTSFNGYGLQSMVIGPEYSASASGQTATIMISFYTGENTKPVNTNSKILPNSPMKANAYMRFSKFINSAKKANKSSTSKKKAEKVNES